MGVFKKLNIGKISLKRKEGGTFIGNALRGVANNLSGGEFGKGNMKLQPKETTSQADERYIKSIGAAAVSFNENLPNQTASGSKPADAFKFGATLEKIKSIYPIIGGVLLTVVVLVLALKKKK